MTTVTFNTYKPWANRAAEVSWTTPTCPGWMSKFEMPIWDAKSGEFFGTAWDKVPAPIVAVIEELERTSGWGVDQREDRELSVTLPWESANE